MALNFTTNQQFKTNLSEISFWFINLPDKPDPRWNKSSFIYTFLSEWSKFQISF